MIAALLVLMMAIDVLALLHSVSRAASCWANADRKKSFWVGLLVVGALLPPLGLLFSAVYGVGVAPYLATDTSAKPFLKR